MHTSRKKFFLLMSIFILPMLMSMYLYFFHDHFHFKTMNHGTLITPAMQVSSITFPEQHKWRIVYAKDKTCDAVCEKQIYQLGQVKKALGKESDRVTVMAVASQAIDKNKIYLVDPLGNFLMVYQVTVNPMFILKDMKRLLEVSQIG